MARESAESPHVRLCVQQIPEIFGALSGNGAFAPYFSYFPLESNDLLSRVQPTDTFPPRTCFPDPLEVLRIISIRFPLLVEECIYSLTVFREKAREFAEWDMLQGFGAFGDGIVLQEEITHSKRGESALTL